MLVPSTTAPEAPLKEIQQRAQPWSHMTVDSLMNNIQPPYLLRGLLARKEVDELIDVVRQGMTTNQEVQSTFHGIVSLDKLPHLNASKAIQQLNARLAVLSGLPETHIEEGYFSIYNEGYKLDHLHLDNHHALFSPLRVVSFVIYLVGEADGLTGGGTVFPLISDDVRPNQVLEWEETLNNGRVNFTLGQDPQALRICPFNGHSVLTHDPCPKTLRLSKKLCETAAHKGDARKPEGRTTSVVRAQPGDAVMFYSTDASGLETVRAMHASCSVKVGDKVVLAKFIRSGPKPFNDEGAFTKARQHHQRSRAARDSPGKSEL